MTGVLVMNNVVVLSKKHNDPCACAERDNMFKIDMSQQNQGSRKRTAKDAFW